MHPHITLRDWTMIALLGAALIVYGLGLVSQALASGAPDNAPRICILSGANAKAIDSKE